jgi:NitT/TauT family transport system substrate-binding protein
MTTDNKTTVTQSDTTTVDNTRRSLIQAGASSAALGVLGFPAIVRAQSSSKIRIGYWPIAAGLPFYAAVEKGFFKEAGLDVEPLKFAAAAQIMEAMLAGRCDGSANGTGSANLAIGEIAAPGTFKIFASNPSNVKNVLDEMLVPANSTAKIMADLKGKRVGSGPGIQNVTLAKIILEKNGIANPTVTELPVGQHVPALAAGQVDAVYTLEPTGTAGRLKGLTRVLEVGVMLAYERFTERGGYQDKRREVVVFVEREAITENERGRRDVSEESWIIVLGVAPFGDGGG